MNSEHILSLCLQTFQDLSRPLKKTIAAAAAALIGCEVVGVSSLGRELEGPAQPDSGIRRMERLVANPRLEIPAVCGGLVRKLIRPHRRTYVCMDWTDHGDYQRLDLSVATGSRTIPVFWKVVPKDLFSTTEISQNQVEEDVLRAFVTLLPTGAEVVLLADRGFGRTELFRSLRGLPLFYVIRIKGDAWLRFAQGTFRLKEQSVPPGHVWDLGLVTNLPDEALHVAGSYGRRFDCEETFRNQKDLRFGFGLKLVHLKEAVRYERLLVVVAVACLVAFGVGVHCEKTGLHGRFQANTRTTRQHNLIGLGCYWFQEVRLTVRGLIEVVIGAVLSQKVAFDGAVCASPQLTYRARPPRNKPPIAKVSPPAPFAELSVAPPPPAKTEEQIKQQMAFSRRLAM